MCAIHSFSGRPTLPSIYISQLLYGLPFGGLSFHQQRTAYVHIYSILYIFAGCLINLRTILIFVNRRLWEHQIWHVGRCSPEIFRKNCF